MSNLTTQSEEPTERPINCGKLDNVEHFLQCLISPQRQGTISRSAALTTRLRPVVIEIVVAWIKDPQAGEAPESGCQRLVAGSFNEGSALHLDRMSSRHLL